MKRIFALVVLFGLGINASCQEAVPAAVEKAFTSKFAKATDVRWEMEKAGEWEAEFKLDGKKMSANFDDSGKWMETETRLAKSDLPAEALAAITDKYADFEIDEVEGVETPDFSGFEVELEKQNQKVEVLVTKDGTITLKKESGDDDDSEDDETDK